MHENNGLLLWSTIHLNGREQFEHSSKRFLWCYSDTKELRVWNDMSVRNHDRIVLLWKNYFLALLSNTYTSNQDMAKEYAHATEDCKMLLVPTKIKKCISYKLRVTVRISSPLFFLFIFLAEYLFQLNEKSRNVS